VISQLSQCPLPCPGLLLREWMSPSISSIICPPPRLLPPSPRSSTPRLSARLPSTTTAHFRSSSIYFFFLPPGCCYQRESALFDPLRMHGVIYFTNICLLGNRGQLEFFASFSFFRLSLRFGFLWVVMLRAAVLEGDAKELAALLIRILAPR